MDSLVQDLRLAFRTLTRTPGFSLIIVLTLGLGIGANTAIFSLMDQVMFRSLPVQDPGQVVLLDSPGPQIGRVEGSHVFSYPMYKDFRDQNTVFSGVLAQFPVSATMTSDGGAERVEAVLVTGTYFQVLGVKAAVGRTFTAEDEKVPGGHPVVVLAHGFWVRRFGADPSILNKTLRLNGHPMTVVGISAPGFHGISVGSVTDVFVPVMMKAELTPTWNDLDNRRSMWLNVAARLKPGVTREQAQTELNVLFHRVLLDEVNQIPNLDAFRRARLLKKTVLVLPGYNGFSYLREQFSTPLLLLMGMVGLVLLIACANVANLLLARAAARQREVAIRLSLGASRWQIARQLLVESVVLALAGGVTGVIIASWTGDFLLSILPFEEARRAFSAQPDMRMALFTLAVSVFTGLLFGLAPAIQASWPDMTQALKDETGSVAGSARHVRFRKGLVVAQVALSLLLLVGAGLFTRSLYNLRALNPGFNVDRLITFSMDPSLNGYAQTRMVDLFTQLQQRVAGLPGVRSVSMASIPPLTDTINMSTVRVEGYQSRDGEDLNPHVNTVSPGYFATMGMPLLAGRDFTERDQRGAPMVAVINETMARYFWNGQNPIGRRFGFGRHRSASEIEVVGVVKDGKDISLREDVARMVFLPYAQDESLSQLTFFVRTTADGAVTGDALRRAVRQVDPAIPVFDVKTATAVVSESLFLDRIVALLSACFGLLATILAAVGLYGVMSYSVARRTRELGLRMAIGAPQGAVLWLVLKDVAVLAAFGIALGLPMAIGLGQVVRSRLFGVAPTDPLTLGIAISTLGIVSILAGYVPARQATQVDPLQALRHE